MSLADIIRQIEVLSQVTGTEGISHFAALSGLSGQILEMAARAGIEPVVRFLQACIEAVTSEIEKSANAHIGTLKMAEFREVIAAWSILSSELRTAVLAVARAAKE